MTKAKILEVVNELPQNIELEDLLEKLIFIDKVEKGLEQINAGNTYTHQRVKDQIKQW